MGDERDTIIFFDDDVPLMRAFASFLEDDRYKVHVATDEEKLLQLLATPVSPALLLVDYYLLGERAGEFIEELKISHAAALARCAIVGWSSLDPESAKKLNPKFHAAISGFAEKPFGDSDLRALVEKYISR